VETRCLDSTDRELLTQAATGQTSAFTALVDRHAAHLHRLATMMTGNAADAQDLVQETFLGAYQQLRRFEGRASVRTWLIAILLKQIASHHRRSSYRKTLSLDSPAATTSEPTAAASTNQSDAKLDLTQLLDQLEADHKQVLLLREIEGLSYDQIAQLLAIPRGTVESRLFRARQALREQAQRSEKA
jgi:RNA polymerase sigma-70 factor, ECF subfamily